MDEDTGATAARPETAGSDTGEDEPVGGGSDEATGEGADERRRDDVPTEQPPIELSDARAPEWPFRGIVQAFAADIDGNDVADLVLQYHDSTTRVSSEIVIKNYGAPAVACRPGIRYNEREVWLAGARSRVFVRWGESAQVREPGTRTPQVTDTWTSQDDDELSAAGTRFSAVDAGDGVWITADEVAGSYRISASAAEGLPGSPEENRDSTSGEVWFRGTDGDLLAMSYSPDGRFRCDDQLTAVVSLRTGETVACGRHAGDIELVTPAGEGLAVGLVTAPVGDTLSFDGCDRSLVQRPLDAGADGSFFATLATLPALSDLYPPRCWPDTGGATLVRGGTLPAAPFHGMVSTSTAHDRVCGEDRIVVRLHDARTRRTSVFTVVNAEQLPCASGITATADGFGLHGYKVQDDPGQTRTLHYLVEFPWGGQPRVSRAGTFRGWPSMSHFSVTPELAWYDEFELAGEQGTTAIAVQSHTNGIRLSVGEHLRGYALSPSGTSKAPLQSALMGRFLLGDSYVGLNGTDGEHVAFTWRDSNDDCPPKDVYVLSLRGDGVLACGTLDSGDLLLIAPAGGGLSTEEVELPESGWLDKAKCRHGLDAGMFEALESLPSTSLTHSTALPGTAPFPLEAAPPWPFRGVVRAAERYQPDSHRVDLAVQFFDTDTGRTTEALFTESAIAGWGRDFFVAALGIGIANDPLSGDRLVMPWGGVPQRITAGTAAATGWQPRAGSPERYPTSLPLGDATLEVAGYEPWPVGVLHLAHGAAARWYVTASPPEPAPDELELHVGEQGPAWTAHLRGTDGSVLALSYLHQYLPHCESDCGLELTYLISLATGRVLACGVEPRLSELAFVMPPGADAPAEIVLPPSGWLDPEPCLRGPSAAGRGCSVLVHGDEPADRCIREFDLRSVTGGIDGASVRPATVTVHLRD